MRKTDINDIMEEKRLILSDALLVSVIRSEAEKVGVTVEEYVDKFLNVFYNAPEKLISIANDQIL